MTTNDGGPAFPRPASMMALHDEPTLHRAFAGMSLRDWFAGQALAGMLAGLPDADRGPKGYAHDAYLIAAAMLAERERRK